MGRYSKKDFEDAALAVRGGMSKILAAKMLGIPRTTLVDKLKGRYPIGKKKCPATSLSEKVESLIARWIQEIAAKGFPTTKCQLLASVGHYLELTNEPNNFKNNVPSSKWYYGFLKRHPELTSRSAQNLTPSPENKIRRWHKEIASYLTDHKLMEVMLDPSRIYNMDESAFYLTPKSDKLITRKGARLVHLVSGNDEKESQYLWRETQLE